MVWCWWGWASAQRIFEYSEGVAIGSGRKRMPKESINLLTEDEIERHQWRKDESQK